MIVDITPERLPQIKNQALARYAAIYLEIYEDFMAQVAASGIEIAAEDDTVAADARRQALRRQGTRFRNTDRSIYVNAISPACVACQKGIGSATYFLSLQCHRDCYYCFNPNQVDYDFYQTNRRSLVRELAQARADGRLDYIALTGGEPLVHAEETVRFFSASERIFPEAHTRLYTTGDQLTPALLARLQEAGLEEIRFSIRMHDLARGQRHTYEQIALARAYVSTVMVEMPVLPGTLTEMKAVLRELEALQIHSINLLEFCYPLNNAAAFRKRGFQARRRPFRTLYNYWYAGGVPIAGSELACLDLLAFALEEDLSIGVHYCSLENKLTGQNYQQNYGRQAPGPVTFSEKDYLWKSAKVFGSDIPPVYNHFRNSGYDRFVRSRNPKYLAFHPEQIPNLRDMEIEIGLCTSTLEEREDGRYLRELKVELTTPQAFSLEAL
mgnify:CR=1 FL=1